MVIHMVITILMVMVMVMVLDMDILMVITMAMDTSNIKDVAAIIEDGKIKGGSIPPNLSLLSNKKHL